ncbi:MAG TPA: dUTP diphosphatase [Nocardioides sp.]
MVPCTHQRRGTLSRSWCPAAAGSGVSGTGTANHPGRGARRQGPARDRPRARVVPESGPAARHGISIVNTPGTIDAGYRGEIKVLLVNHDPREPVELHRGDRVAQLVIQRFEQAVLTEVDALPESVRGSGGYGSTGGSGALGEPTPDHP